MIPIVLTSFPSVEEAKNIAKTLVQERLVGYFQVVAVESGYRIGDVVKDSVEAVCLLHTVTEHIDRLELRLKSLHPNDVPQFIVIESASASQAYLDWFLSLV